jgi:hypothetical protein
VDHAVRGIEDHDGAGREPGEGAVLDADPVVDGERGRAEGRQGDDPVEPLSQKRLAAKGRSAEMLSRTVSSRAETASLKRRALVAQTGVSRLGTMLRIFFLPAKSSSPLSERSAAASENAGARLPRAGRSPDVWIGEPFSVIFAIAHLVVGPP